MRKGIVVSDSGPIFYLAILDKLNLLVELFEEIYIPNAVWIEITRVQSTEYYPKIIDFFKDKIKEISGFNDLIFVMDYGESESVILYKNINASFLLIDDKKARSIAENFDIQCIGTIGILSTSREKGLITELRPLFENLLKNKRFYSLGLLNSILRLYNEKEIPPPY